MAAFIVFEGIDGSGKSTQARALYRRLVNREILALLTHEPGGTPLGEALRRWVKRRQGLYPLTELYLFNAARAQLVEQVIRPALKMGVTVLADRCLVQESGRVDESRETVSTSPQVIVHKVAKERAINQTK